MDEPIKIWTDGCCFPNPGQGGWAWTTLKGESDYGGLNPTTNNVMELTAPIKAIEALWKPGRKLLILSDSDYVVKGISFWVHTWVENGWQTKTNKEVKNLELWQDLYTLVIGRWISFKWVRGHSGDPGNEEADRLANIGSGASEELIRESNHFYMKYRKRA